MFGAGEYITGDKQDQLWDAISDNRRVHMQNTSARRKQALRAGPPPEEAMVNVGQIHLLHAVDDGANSKTRRRIDYLSGQLENFEDRPGITWQGDGCVIDCALMDNECPLYSKDPILLGVCTDADYKAEAEEYITLEGVGRVYAMKVAGLNAGVDVSVVALVGGINKAGFEELKTVHESYYVVGGDGLYDTVDYSPDGVLNRTFGLGRYVGGGALNFIKWAGYSIVG